jgi:hypothetical protein
MYLHVCLVSACIDIVFACICMYKQEYLPGDMLKDTLGAPWKTGILAKRHASWNRAVVSRREKGQTAGIRSGHIQQLGPDFSAGAGPPSPALPWAVVVHGLDQRVLTLHNTPGVCEDTHLKNQVDTAIPAGIIINRRAEGGTRSHWQSNDQKILRTT